MAKQDNEPIFVEVHWTDAVNHSGWVTNVKDCKTLTVVQRGWLLDSTQDYVVLSMSKPDTNGDYLGVQTIPRGMVTEFWEIEVS